MGQLYFLFDFPLFIQNSSLSEELQAKIKNPRCRVFDGDRSSEPRSIGLTKGQGNFLSISKQMMTKLENKTIGNISGKTFGKMIIADFMKDAYTHTTEVGFNVGLNSSSYQFLQNQLNSIQTQLTGLKGALESLIR